MAEATEIGTVRSWLNLQGIMLSEINRQKDIHGMTKIFNLLHFTAHIN